MLFTVPAFACWVCDLGCCSPIRFDVDYVVAWFEIDLLVYGGFGFGFGF